MKLKTKKTRKTIIIAVLVLLALAGGVSVYKKMKAEAESNKVSAVSTAVTERMDVRSELSSTGILKPKDTYQVTSLAEGEVTSAEFETGSKVEKGQVLYRMDVSNMKAEMEAAAGAVGRAGRSYEEAKKDYDQAMAQYGNNTYLSSGTGYIKKLYIQVGDSVASGGKIADVYDDRVMKLKVPFLSPEAATIAAGNPAVVTLAATQEQLNGTVTAVSGKEETLTGGRLVRYVTIEVANPGGLTTEHSAVASVGEYTCSVEGTFLPTVETVLNAELPGNVTVEQLLISEGDYVEKGSPLFRFDGQSSEKILRTFRDNLDRAKDSQEAAQGKLDSTKSNMDNYTITAPISGTVIKKNTKSGDKISKGGENSVMAVIYDLSAITFSMSVDELDITKVREGQTVQITADAAGGKTYEGTVTNVSLESANSNGITTYPVSVTVKDPEGLLPGMNVSGRILLAESKNALVIPVDGLLRGNVVYVKDASVKEAKDAVPAGFREVTVETGIISDAFVEIKSGLSEGDEVYRMPDTTEPNMEGADDSMEAGF